MPRLGEEQRHSIPVWPDPANPNPRDIAAQLITATRQMWQEIERLRERVTALEKQVEDHATYLDG